MIHDQIIDLSQGHYFLNFLQILIKKTFFNGFDQGGFILSFDQISIITGAKFSNHNNIKYL